MGWLVLRDQHLLCRGGCQSAAINRITDCYVQRRFRFVQDMYSFSHRFRPRWSQPGFEHWMEQILTLVVVALWSSVVVRPAPLPIFARFYFLFARSLPVRLSMGCALWRVLWHHNSCGRLFSVCPQFAGAP